MKIFFILPATRFINRFPQNLDQMVLVPDFFAYAYYDHQLESKYSSKRYIENLTKFITHWNQRKCEKLLLTLEQHCYEYETS